MKKILIFIAKLRKKYLDIKKNIYKFVKKCRGKNNKIYYFIDNDEKRF